MGTSRPLALTFLLLASCGDERGVVVPPATGDPTVFAEIDVRIESSEFEFLDAERPAGPGFGVNVYVNKGTFEGRVPGLEVFINGAAIDDVQRAIALGERDYAYQHYPKPVVRNQRTVVEFRYRGATYSVQTDTVLGEITTPLTDQVVPAADPVTVRWSGAVPKTVDFRPAWGFAEQPAARTDSAGGGETTFVMKTPDSGWPKLPWTGDLTIEWSPERSLSSPFRSLTLEAGLRRLARFQLE